nr:unnamed protein product [Spirometra erinaceieuropaei]
MTLYGADAVALSAIFHDVATEFDLLNLFTRPTLTNTALQESNNTVLQNYLAEPADINQHFQRVLQKCGSLKKSKHVSSAKSQQENVVTKWTTLEDGLETYLYERKVKEISAQHADLFRLASEEMKTEGTVSHIERYVADSARKLAKLADIVSRQVSCF